MRRRRYLLQVRRTVLVLGRAGMTRHRATWSCPFGWSVA